MWCLHIWLSLATLLSLLVLLALLALLALLVLLPALVRVFMLDLAGRLSACHRASFLIGGVNVVGSVRAGTITQGNDTIVILIVATNGDVAAWHTQVAPPPPVHRVFCASTFQAVRQAVAAHPGQRPWHTGRLVRDGTAVFGEASNTTPDNNKPARINVADECPQRLQVPILTR